jgi:Iap family predicted aminopeptidase
MEGRRTATPGAARAARFLARQLESFGTLPAGDSGYYQRVPMMSVVRSNGRPGLALLSSLSDLDTVPVERRVMDVNVIGMLQGADPEVADEAVVVGAHFDHVGIGRPVNGDSIYNGADDDASGVVAVLEIARALVSGPAPRRTVIFLLSTGEEMGLLGTRWYLEHPVVPLERTVADLQIEMIGRPDSMAGGSGRAWLTGYERSTMGDMLRDAGNPIVPDPHPEQGFFQRSDNIAFAYRGIPAHTLSSYGLHADYHRPSDETDSVDFAHMTGVIESAIAAVRLIADGEPPSWHPGGRPERRR